MFPAPFAITGVNGLSLNGKAQAFTRRGFDCAEKYPTIVEAAGQLPVDFRPSSVDLVDSVANWLRQRELPRVCSGESGSEPNDIRGKVLGGG
jgi:hypothetical protein